MFLCFLQLLHQAITTPILYDFYNYDGEKKEFAQLFVKFTQVSHACLQWHDYSRSHLKLMIMLLAAILVFKWL